jgi:hypothetical protein
VPSTEGGFVKVFKENGQLVGTLKDAKGEASFTAISNVRIDPDGLIYLGGPDTIEIVKADPKP